MPRERQKAKEKGEGGLTGETSQLSEKGDVSGKAKKNLGQAPRRR